MKKFLLSQSGLIALFLLLVFTTNAQWVSNGPYGGGASAIETVGTTVFAGAGHGIYRSTDNGASWTLVTSTGSILWISDITAFNNVIYAGTSNNKGVYVSTDGGTTWTQKNSGLSSLHIETIFAGSDGVFAQTGSGTFFSSDGGNSWSTRKTGLPVQGIITYAQTGDTVWAGSYGAGLYYTTDAGLTWTKHASFPANAYVHGIAIEGTQIYATTEAGLYRSDDNGQTWASTNTVLWNYATIAVKQGTVFAGMEDEGIYVSTDMGVTFAKMTNGFEGYPTNGTGTFPRVPDFALSGNVIIAATYDGIYSSSNNGSLWTNSDQGILGTSVMDVAASGNYVYAGAGRMYASSNKGQTWMRSNNGLATGNVIQVVTHGSSVFLSTGGSKIYRSSDNGASWVDKSTGITNIADLLAADENRILAVVRGLNNANQKLMQSTNNGDTWTELQGAMAISGGITAIAIRGDYIYAGTNYGMLLRSSDEGASWRDIGGYLPTVKITVILPEEDATYVGTAGKGVFQFTKNDEMMKTLSEGLTFYDISDLEMHEDFLFASTAGAGIFVTNKGGNRWFKTDGGLNTSYVTSLAAANGVVYAGTNAGVYQTDNTAFDSFRTLAGIPNNKTATTLQLNIFPNPASENLNYTVDTGYQFEFYSMSGSVLHSYSVTKGEGSIDISGFEAGVYFLKMQSDNETIYRKLIVK